MELSGDGEIVAFSLIKVVAADMAARGYNCDRPYVSGYVVLKEGLTIPARIEAPEHLLRVGLPVKAEFLDESNDDQKQVTLVFRSA